MATQKTYGLAMTTETAIKLRELRMRAGLSMQAVAKAAGYRGASSYQRYEDPAAFANEKLPLKLVARLADVLVGKGSPPITQSEVFNLSGINSIRAATDAAHVFDGGFYENGAEPIGESPADGLRLAEHVAPFRILNNAMNRHPLAMVEGDTAYADCSGETVENIQMGDAVIVQCLPRTADGEPKTIVMQVVSPLLLVSNSSGDNFVVRVDDPSLPFEPIIRGRIVSVSPRKMNG